MSPAARGPGRSGGHVLVTMAGVSGGGGERVVAGPGQDVMGLPEDLAGLPQAVQVIGPRYREDLCLDAGQAIEASLGIITPIDPR